MCIVKVGYSKCGMHHAGGVCEQLGLSYHLLVCSYLIHTHAGFACDAFHTCPQTTSSKHAVDGQSKAAPRGSDSTDDLLPPPAGLMLLCLEWLISNELIGAKHSGVKEPMYTKFKLTLDDTVSYDSSLQMYSTFQDA